MVYGYWTRTQRHRTLAEVSVEVELRARVPIPVYQRIAAQAAEMRDQGVSVTAIARYFGVDYHTAAKALRWFEQR